MNTRVERLPLKWLDRIAAVLLFLAVVVLLLVLVVGPLGATSREGIAARHAERSVVFQGGRIDVPLRIEGTTLPVCSSTSTRSGSAVILVIDHSGSMGGGAGSPLEAAKAAAADFVPNLSLSSGDDLIGAVQFDDGAQIVYALGQDPAAAQQAIGAIAGGGGTQIHEGLRAAVQALTPPPAGKTPAIVLLSDGGSDRQAAIAAADAAKAADIRIITIALGDADADLLRQLASDPDSDFYATPDPAALQGIYQEIAAAVGPVVATNVTVAETFDTGHFEPSDDATPASGRIDRRFAVLTTGGRQISYSLRAQRIGRWQISPQPGVLTYDDCSGQQVSQAMPPGPRVLVLFPLFCLLIPLLIALAWLLYRIAYWYWKNYIWEPTLPPRPNRTFPPRRPLPEPLAWKGPTTPWAPEPALIIGLGGTGRWVLTHLKRNLLDAGAGKLRDHVRLLALDTAAGEYVGGTERRVSFANTLLDPSETLVVTEENLGDLIQQVAQADRGQYPELEQWFPAADYDQRLSPAQRDLARGANGRRPMGRIAIFRNLKDGLDASSLWARLTQGVAEIRQAALERNASYQRVRIVVVASLAGGFGSGSVVDVAYLARRACEAQGLKFGDAEVSLFLVGNAPFDAQIDYLGDTPLTHINARAALREVERFLLSRNRPFKIEYTADAADPVLNGQARNVLDDCWFLDGDRADHSLAAQAASPERALFPMIADAITVLLDTQAQSAGAALGALRQQVAGRTLALQAELGQAVFSSFGAFTYRLPMRDLVAFLQARFARQLLALLLFGDENADFSRTPDAMANKEAAGIAPRTHAVNFMAGRAGSGDAPLPLHVAFAIHSSAPLAEHHEALIDVGLRSQKEGEAAYLEHEKQDFTLYLQDALWRLLNGGQATSIAEARAGKLVYAQTFLKELNLLFGQIGANQNWQRGQGRLPRWTPRVVQLLPEILNQYSRIARLFLEQLQQTEQLLRTTVYGERKAADQATCVVEELAHNAQQAQDNLQLLQGVTMVRRYLLAEQDAPGVKRRTELLDVWYRTHFEPNLARALEYVAWEAPTTEGSPPGLALTLRISSANGIPLERAAIPAFADGLLLLAEHAGQQVWRPEEAVRLLADALEGIGSDLARLEEIHRLGGPVLPYVGAGSGQHVAENRFLWSPAAPTDARWDAARAQLAAGLDRQTVTPFNTLNGSDLFAVTSLYLRDYVAMNAIARLSVLDESYLRYYNLIPAVGIGALAAGQRNPEPSAVFPAENRANRLFERRMLQMPERTGWLLSSLFVGALDDLVPMERFLEAYAAGLLSIGRHPGGGENVCLLALQPEPLYLTTSGNEAWGIALEVIGMQNFVLGSEDRRLSSQPAWPDRLALLESALAQLTRPVLEQRWQDFDLRYLNRPRNLGAYGLDDLVMCARIHIRRELNLP